MKKLAIVLSAAMVFGAASVALAADPAKVSGEVVFKGMFGRNDIHDTINPKTWETGKLGVSGNVNPQLGYNFGIKYDMPSGTNNWPNGNMSLQLDKAAITYTHQQLPLTVTLGKSAMVGARTSYWDALSNNYGAEGIQLKSEPVKNLTLQALIQPFDAEDETSVSLKNIFADYKTPVGDFGLNIRRNNTESMDYSIEGTVPVPHTPVTVAGEVIRFDGSDEFNYILGAKATLGANTLFVETTDQAYAYVHQPSQSSSPKVNGTAIGLSRNIAGMDTSVKYAMIEGGSSKLTAEAKVKF